MKGRIKKMTHSRSGFSLVELICVLAIISVLVGIVLPAVQSLREAARFTSCKNNLRQLALATLNFESANRELPPGTLGYPGSIWVRATDSDRWNNDPSYPFYLHNNQNTSWIVFTLPFLEETNLFDQLPPVCTNRQIDYATFRRQNGGPKRMIDIPEVNFAARQSLAIIGCPSDPAANDPKSCMPGSQPAFLLDQKLDHFLIYQYDEKLLATTNYAGCSGAYSGGRVPVENMEMYAGVFQSRARTPTAFVADGTSQTILLGETLGMINDGKREIGNPWFFATLNRARSDLDWQSAVSVRTPMLDLFGDYAFAFPAGFGSMHPGIVNFAMVDGSVSSLSRATDWQTLYSLCGARDGKLASSE